MLLVAPSDHVVPDSAAFVAAVQAGLAAVEQGRLVTFGIQPTYPETGYGYLELGEDPAGKTGALALSRFVEKPDAARATQMLQSGKYLWNSGIFLFRARDITAAFQQHMPQMLDQVTQAVAEAQEDIGFLRLAPAPWAQLEDISIDHAVMEKADNLSVVPFAAGWSDLGGWDAVWREGARDAQGVQATGATTAIDCENTLLRSDSEGLELVGIGLKDMVVVAMDDAVLVADKSPRARCETGCFRAEEKGRETGHRPAPRTTALGAGSKALPLGLGFRSNASTSILARRCRCKAMSTVRNIGSWLKAPPRSPWIAKRGWVTENESIYIPLGAVHRMENPGKVPMVLIEVQTGSYVGEDDIIPLRGQIRTRAGGEGIVIARMIRI